MARVPDCDSEHAPQPLGEPVAELLVEMEQDLGVAVRSKAMPAPLELVP
jgi:hypothetical protein